MAYRVTIRLEVVEEGELGLIPRADLKAALRAIRDEPLRGDALQRQLKGCRSWHVGDNRIVYRIHGEEVEVLAVGRRRAEEAYRTATKRT